MSTLTEALNRIANWLQQHIPKRALSLTPGLTRPEIEEIVKDLPIKFPQELYELYQWSNGPKKAPRSQNSHHIFIFPGGFALLPLQEAVEIYREKLKSSKYYYQFEMDYYNPSLFQIFFCYIGELKGCAVIMENSEKCGVISILKCEEIRRQYISVTSMMLTIAEYYEQGYSYISDDSKEFNEIWRKYNSSLADAVVAQLTGDISYMSLLEISRKLIEFKDSRTVEPLIQILEKPALKNEDLSKQQLAARILGEIGDIRAIESLINALQNEYWVTRKWAVVSLGKLNDKRAVEFLTNVTLQDSCEEVQRIARRVLDHLS